MIYTHDLLMLIVEVAINIAAFYLGFNAAKDRKVYGTRLYATKYEKRRMTITIFLLIIITFLALMLDVLTR